MKKKIIITISVVAVLALGTIMAVAAQHQFGKHRGRGFGGDPEKFIEHGINRAATALDLTDEQKTRIKAIMEAEKPVVQPLIQQVAAQRQELRQATSNGQFNEAQVQELATKQGQTMTQLIIAKERVKAQIFAVLTPEQRAKAEQMHSRFMGRGPGRFNK